MYKAAGGTRTKSILTVAERFIGLSQKMSDFRARLEPSTGLAAAGSSRAVEHLGCRVLVSGYLADRDALCRSFGLESPARGGDAELLARAFRRWGRALSAHVDGEYAAVVYDVQSGVALLTHDAVGLGSLFYRRCGEELQFATNLIDMTTEPRSERLDEEYFADFLARGFIADHRTPYHGVERLLPGRALWWSAGSVQHLRTWEVADAAPIVCRDDAEYEERFRELLGAAVRSSADGSGKTWVSLSGGLDSSSVACVARALGVPNLGAYSLTCERWRDADERFWMRAVIDHTGIPWHTVDVEAVLPFSALPGAFHGEPTQQVIQEAQLRAEAELLRAHGVDVMLNGHAGDVVLCASPGLVPTHLADHLFDGRPLTALRAVAEWGRGARERRPYAHWLLLGLVAPAIDHLRGRSFRNPDVDRFPTWVQHEYRRTMRIEARRWRRVERTCRQPGRQTLSRDLWMMATSIATIPRNRFGHELRNPLLHRPLVAFMSAIPWEQKIRPRCDRWLQRRALKGILPEAVRVRGSKGAGTPAVVEGLRRSPEWQAYLCDDSELVRRGIVAADDWRTAVRQAAVGHTQDDKTFFAAIAIEVWLRQWRARVAEPRAGNTFDAVAAGHA